MVVVYNQESAGLGGNRNRHAIYHFYNTRNNASIPAVSISGNLFYKNTILKEEHGYNPSHMRQRLIEFAGGDPRAAYTVLNKIVKNRYRNVHTWLRPDILRRLNNGSLKVTNINNTHLKNRRSIRGFNPEHWGHFKQYTRLLRAMHNTDGPAYTKVTRTNRSPLPNAQLVNFLQSYYTHITRGARSDRYRGIQAARINPILQRIYALVHTRNTLRRQRVARAATRIQSVVRGRIARRQSATIRTARTGLPPQRRVNAVASVNLRRILGINASRR
jgi:hypothetical protein